MDYFYLKTPEFKSILAFAQLTHLEVSAEGKR